MEKLPTGTRVKVFRGRKNDQEYPCCVIGAVQEIERLSEFSFATVTSREDLNIGSLGANSTKEICLKFDSPQISIEDFGDGEVRKILNSYWIVYKEVADRCIEVIPPNRNIRFTRVIQ